jgi:TolA-binding protein
MKRVERRNLKHNDLADLATKSQQIVGEYKSSLTLVFIVIVVAGAAGLGYMLWKNGVETRAHTMLAAAMSVEDTPVGPVDPNAAQKGGARFATAQEKEQATIDKYKAAADQYPSTDAGIFARYHQATALVGLNRTADAAPVFQQVIDHDSKGIYGQMARFGLAESQARAGQFDQAIATYKELVEAKDSSLPLDGILMQLGRTYLYAGKNMDAQQTFNRVVNEFPQSQFGPEARQQLDTLKKS